MCPREERQFALRDYSFICKCPRCNDDIENTIDYDLISDIKHNIIKPDDTMLNERIEEIKKLRDESESLDSADERIEKLKDACDLCNKYLYKYHYLTLSVKSALLIAYSEANLIGKALYISNEVVEGFKYIYGEYHPVYALQLYTQGNLKDLLGQHHDAYVVLNDARTKLLLSYLPTDPMIEDLNSYIESVKESIDQVKINHKLDS